MGIQSERSRIEYFKADIVQPEKTVQAVGRFLCQRRDIPGQDDSVCQLDQKMKKIIVMTVFHIVKTVMIAMDCRHVFKVCCEQQGLYSGWGERRRTPCSGAFDLNNFHPFPGGNIYVFLRISSILAYVRYRMGCEFQGVHRAGKRVSARRKKGGNTVYYRLA